MSKPRKPRLLSVVQAAEKLGVHRTRVLALINAGRLPARKVGRAYVIEESDLALVQDRKPGRPAKGSR